MPKTGSSKNCEHKVDRHKSPNVDRRTPVSTDTPYHVDRHAPAETIPTSIRKPAEPERVYTPKVPYPKLPKRSKKEIEDAKCKEILDDLEVRIPFFEACQMAPALRKYVKKMVSKAITHEEGANLITETCSKLIQSKMPKKMKDPGSFVLNCEINGQPFEHSLCDLGSAVNLMPYSVAKKLGMTDLAPTSVVLVLADRTVRVPKGLLEDVPIKIGNWWFPADFIVLDYDGNDAKDPLILGRPLLATAGVNIDCRKGRIELRLEDETMVFEIDKSSKKPTIDGQSFLVETLDAFEDVSKVEKVHEEVINLGKEKQKTTVQPSFAKKSATPSTADKQKVPNITPHAHPQKERYAYSKPSSSYAGKRSNPPKLGAHPGTIPRFLGRSHAPTAYTPPWMRRIVAKDSLPSTKPPAV